MTKRTIAEIAKEAGLLPQAKRIWIDHPFLEQISTRLADFIGMYPQDAKGNPLLVSAMIAAVTAFGAKKGKSTESDASDRYISSLINTGAEIFSQDVCIDTPSGTVRWLPFEHSAEEFFGRFPENQVSVMFRPSSVPRNIAICCLVVKVVPQALWNDVASPRLFQEFTEAH